MRLRRFSIEQVGCQIFKAFKEREISDLVVNCIDHVCIDVSMTLYVRLELYCYGCAMHIPVAVNALFYSDNFSVMPSRQMAAPLRVLVRQRSVTWYGPVCRRRCYVSSSAPASLAGESRRRR